MKVADNVRSRRRGKQRVLVRRVGGWLWIESKMAEKQMQKRGAQGLGPVRSKDRLTNDGWESSEETHGKPTTDKTCGGISSERYHAHGRQEKDALKRHKTTSIPVAGSARVVA